MSPIHKCPPEEHAMFAAEAQWRREASTLTPQEWRKRLLGIRGRDTRIQTAAIVWWDFCTAYPFGILKEALADMADAWTCETKTSRRAVQCALVKIGFPKRLAQYRTRKANDIPWNYKPSARLHFHQTPVKIIKKLPGGSP